MTTETLDARIERLTEAVAFGVCNRCYPRVGSLTMTRGPDNTRCQLCSGILSALPIIAALQAELAEVRAELSDALIHSDGQHADLILTIKQCRAAEADRDRLARELAEAKSPTVSDVLLYERGLEDGRAELSQQLAAALSRERGLREAVIEECASVADRFSDEADPSRNSAIHDRDRMDRELGRLVSANVASAIRRLSALASGEAADAK